MHTSRVNNFLGDVREKSFATVVVTLGAEDGDMQINTSMSSSTSSDVTMFFNSVEEISQFATDLLDQAKAEEKECTCENCKCSKEGK